MGAAPPDRPDLTAIAAGGLDLLMPMHVRIGSHGRILGCGPTIAKLHQGHGFLDRPALEVMDVRRPSGVEDLRDLRRLVGRRLYLKLAALPGLTLRGIAVPMPGGGLLLNLSFGIDLIEAVRDCGLTDADFAPTDLAVELLYVVEAKSAVMHELRGLNLRLQGAKSMAEEQALTDTLTGLRNRRALETILRRLVEGRQGFALMHMDLDYFKAVNDTLGHAAGDHVLRVVAQILTDETRANDTVARVGGDEFVLVMPGLADAALATQIAARIIARLSLPIPFEGSICRIAASAGFTLSDSYAQPEAETMLNDADQALYAAKRAGRACVQQYLPPELPAEAPREPQTSRRKRGPSAGPAG
ncbi:GGDEF domain-containing protein [Gemmobacter serpentinus]|uniref:GGDEF domain-containing protein n=1 Tax=Gemmobacter serpentinus TaxID=2652247 RepID=UPI00124DBCC9|nr:GGDEF domain-containing protein [Gemmobacter serpentinus]